MAAVTDGNFQIGTLAAGMAAGATSFSLTSGQGARFDDPGDGTTGAYNVVIWNSDDYATPADAFWASPKQAKIVRITDRSGDGFTCTTNEEGTSDVALNTGGKTYTVERCVSRRQISDEGMYLLKGSTLTISSGQITRPTHPYHYVDTEGAAASDNLDFIQKPLRDLQKVILRQVDSARDITLKHNTASPPAGYAPIHLEAGADFTLTNLRNNITLLYDSTANAGAGAWISLATSPDT